MVKTQILLQLSNADPLVAGEFGYNPIIPNQYQLNETEVGDLPMSETYSGVDVGFYDSPSGLTITPNTEITSYGTGPSIFTPTPLSTPPRDIAWWEYVIVAALVGPARILRFPMWFVEGSQILVGELPQRPQDMPQ